MTKSTRSFAQNRSNWFGAHRRSDSWVICYDNTTIKAGFYIFHSLCDRRRSLAFVNVSSSMRLQRADKFELTVCLFHRATESWSEDERTRKDMPARVLRRLKLKVVHRGYYSAWASRSPQDFKETSLLNMSYPAGVVRLNVTRQRRAFIVQQRTPFIFFWKAQEVLALICVISFRVRINTRSVDDILTVEDQGGMAGSVACSFEGAHQRMSGQQCIERFMAMEACPFFG